MKYKCLIVDDEELARELIETHLKQLDQFELVASCSSAIEASKFLQTTHVHLLFLDIEMPVLKGTDFFKNLAQKPKVIFTTAYRDYAIEGFELDAIDYLLKPIVFQRFFKAVTKFLTQVSTDVIAENVIDSPERKKEFVYVRKNRKQIKVVFNDILYIESLKDYIKVHLKDEFHVVKYSISAFEKELDRRFLRAHRSFIINKDKVTAFTKNDIEIGKLELPIGDAYKQKLFDLLED
ncbi:DNA-binding response regulator, LytR/AlgR family [Tenacibaculum sp. MAR_2009_124]|uniref:LytR/AlgR family response regulator transcription factor n=1 Tax=Tenacibaculum sp. MAR_2009_124 TaxID=1250059 RepID=UPI00089954A1|nr:LytTR family DNA-binding domain-containing protein [Tenacibaculum sp. MAR_2009_124]SEB39284.1 DNA-binding response regulator, LytR/AlgR family [Tenacibaculum sp. MAR_2009_124]